LRSVSLRPESARSRSSEHDGGETALANILEKLGITVERVHAQLIFSPRSDHGDAAIGLEASAPPPPSLGKRLLMALAAGLFGSLLFFIANFFFGGDSGSAYDASKIGFLAFAALGFFFFSRA
jgi:hypothetical protein